MCPRVFELWYLIELLSFFFDEDRNWRIERMYFIVWMRDLRIKPTHHIVKPSIIWVSTSQLLTNRFGRTSAPFDPRRHVAASLIFAHHNPFTYNSPHNTTSQRDNSKYIHTEPTQTTLIHKPPSHNKQDKMPCIDATFENCLWPRRFQFRDLIFSIPRQSNWSTPRNITSKQFQFRLNFNMPEGSDKVNSKVKLNRDRFRGGTSRPPKTRDVQEIR